MQLPTVKTPVTVDEMYAALTVAWPEGGRASKCILLAQWALETGRGRSMICFNCAGIKAVAGQDYATYQTFEIVDGRRITIDDNFKAFRTLEEGVADYLAFLRKHYSYAWSEVEAGSPEGFVHLLKMHGYFTAAEADYVRNVRSLFNEFMAKIPTTEPPPAPPSTIPELPIEDAIEGVVDAPTGPTDPETPA